MSSSSSFDRGRDHRVHTPRQYSRSYIPVIRSSFLIPSGYVTLWLLRPWSWGIHRMGDDMASFSARWQWPENCIRLDSTRVETDVSRYLFSGRVTSPAFRSVQEYWLNGCPEDLDFNLDTQVRNSDLMHVIWAGPSHYLPDIEILFRRRDKGA